MKLFINKIEALDLHMTHEGTLFGVPAWVEDSSGNAVNAVPKFFPLRHWCNFADWIFSLVAEVLPTHVTLTSPIHVGKKIEI